MKSFGKKLKDEAMLYQDSSSDEDDKDGLHSTSDEYVDNIRYLITNNNCYNICESLTAEISMLSTYMFFILFIGLILTASVLGSRNKYFILCIIGCVVSIIIALCSFYIYKKYDKRIMNNPIADIIIYDKTKNLFQIYKAKTKEICGCFRIKNESELLWKCNLSSLQRCEYLENTRILIIYFYDEQHGNDEMKQFQDLYFVNKEWENKINSKLSQCKFDWNIKTRTS